LNEEILKGAPSLDQNERILGALDRAIQLDPNLTWAYYTRAGFEMSITWDWAAAQADAQRIHAIDPRFAYLASALGDIALMFGETGRAVELYQQDIERNPLDPNVLDSLGVALCGANRLDECLHARLRLLQLHPEFGRINCSVGIARLLLGQLPGALEAMHREPDEAYRLSGLALVYSAMGSQIESQAALSSLTDKFGATEAYGIAQVFAYRGERDAAFQWLDRAQRQHHAGMLGVKTDALLRNLHTDPRFQALLMRMKLNTGPT
jgi:serine/threonine-protein kinase